MAADGHHPGQHAVAHADPQGQGKLSLDGRGRLRGNYNGRWSTINIEERRGEKGTRRPGPEGQVLHHALRNFLQDILRRVLHVLATCRPPLPLGLQHQQ